MLNQEKLQEKIKQRHDEYNRIWNTAIEAAASLIDKYKTYEADHAAHEIRKLKR